MKKKSVFSDFARAYYDENKLNNRRRQAKGQRADERVEGKEQKIFGAVNRCGKERRKRAGSGGK